MSKPQPRELLSMADLLTPATIRAAATLRLADHIADGSTTAAALADRLGADPEVVDPLLRHLCELGLLEPAEGAQGTDGGTAYALTPLGLPLLSEGPYSVRQALANDSMTGGSSLSLLRLDHTVLTGEPSSGAGGGSYWERVNNGPEYAAEWAEQAEAVDRLQDGPLNFDAGNIVDAYDWSRVRSVVDVGGHLGVILVKLLRAHPHLRGTLVDLKNVAEQAGKRFANSDVADRAEAVVGSFFDPLPEGDVHLLSAVLADWNDEDAVRILRNCRDAAARSGGTVLSAEVTMGRDSAATELRLRSLMPAPFRPAARVEALAAEAGLEVVWRGPSTAVRTLLAFAPR